MVYHTQGKLIFTLILIFFFFFFWLRISYWSLLPLLFSSVSVCTLENFGDCVLNLYSEICVVLSLSLSLSTGIFSFGPFNFLQFKQFSSDCRIQFLCKLNSCFILYSYTFSISLFIVIFWNFGWNLNWFKKWWVWYQILTMSSKRETN